MNVVSVFSGIGGLDHGLATAGFQHLLLCESDSWRRGVLRERFAGVPVYDDVRHVKGSVAGADANRGVDLLAGGFPCQDVSVAGNRAGLAGDRSSLFHELARLADAFRPRWVLVENVPGLFSSNGGRDFGVVLGTLADLGYGVAWRTLDSRYFGVPQRRRRVFILAVRFDGDPRAAAERAGQVLAVGSRCDRHPPKGGEAGEGSAVASLSGLGSGGPDDNDGQGGRLVTDWSPAIASTLKGHNGKGGSGISPEDTFLVGNGRVVSPEDDRNERLRVGELELSRFSESSVGVTESLDFAAFETHAVGEVGHATDSPQPAPDVKAFSENQRGEVLETPIARQLTSGGGKPGQGYSAVREGASVRRLTPIECERLQGLPDNWTRVPDTAPDSRRYAALGDAVTATVGHWLGTRIATA